MPQSRLTPASLRERIQQLLMQLPPVQRADQRFHEVESGVLLGLKHRLDELDDGPVAQPQNLHQLLDASLEQSGDQAERRLMLSVLNALTPDEARMLAALSDGSGFPMLSLYAGGHWWQRGMVLHRYSNVGRASGIQCNDFVPLYLARLFSLGLVISTPMDTGRRTDYELCEGDSAFRKALEKLQHHYPKLKAARETLTLSPVGETLWALMVSDQQGQGDADA
ncbi:hypothetical protein A11A3_12465 [Alcanivorax hongdengensis A-11-3]|uniref:DUF4393 domain-containing protein n=1 Tax=Alcanivorax hongdengensis A-11-3 TaxID=1177179 RepID=L0W9H3_9GAMM|nr:hypothetical protein [Alcanivorax hongdengensis]EKF73654.1 hypothetical protein A11A3_12465 [Alcanivorax hongdengensis A-11-3]